MWRDLQTGRAAGVSTWAFLKQVQDPIVLAVILEDFAAVTGVVIAGAGDDSPVKTLDSHCLCVGLAMTHYTGNVMWDGLARCWLRLWRSTNEFLAAFQLAVCSAPWRWRLYV